MIVVADNGALGHLVQIERANLLPRLYERVLVPPAVLWEFAAPATPKEIRDWGDAPPTWLEIVAPSGEPDRRRPGAGEREAIRVAKEQGAGLLCDDDRARRQARAQGLVVIGSLGVLQAAHGRGWIDIEAEIACLRARTTMRLPESILPSIVATGHMMRRIASASEATREPEL